MTWRNWPTVQKDMPLFARACAETMATHRVSAVLDDATLIVPDRPGNRRVDTMLNVAENLVCRPSGTDGSDGFEIGIARPSATTRIHARIVRQYRKCG